MTTDEQQPTHIAIKPESYEEVMAADCQECGCCCRPIQDGMAYYAKLSEEDLQRLFDGWQAGSAVKPLPGHLFILPLTGSLHLSTRHTERSTMCALLEGEVGERCSCSVYDKRPQVCRDFAQGSPSCIGMRTYFLNPKVQEIRRKLAARGEFLKPFWPNEHLNKKLSEASGQR